MKRIFARSLVLGSLGILGAVPAFGQADWDFQCIDPGTTTPYSNPFGVTGLISDLMGVAMGVTGTVTYGDSGNPDDDVPCFTTTQNINVVGRFGFMSGFLGSIQDQFPTDPGSGFVDDLMVYTHGMPQSPGGSSCYASTTVDGTRTRFGSAGINLLFTGESNRYFRCTSTNGDIGIQLTVSVVGDAIQFSWLLTNNSATASHNVGLWFGAGLAMLANTPDITGAEMSHFFPNTPTNFFTPGKLGYVTLSSGGRPPLTEKRFRRNINPNGFPQVVDFLFGQTAGFGLRVENGATQATSNNSGQSDATEVGEFVLGQQFFLLGNMPADNNFPDVIFPPIDPNDPDATSDVGFLDNSGFIQKFPEQAVAPGSNRRITHYYRSTWGNSNYTAPYAAVVDAPKLIAEDAGGGPGSANGLRPNPLRIRVYVDNVGGYATVNQEIPLNNVRITLTLGDGLSLTSGTNERTIAVVQPRQIGFVDFDVEADGVAYGDLPYSIRIEPVPGPTKVINGTIRVATTPRLEIKEDANLVTAPWTFSDTSWETVLSPLQSPEDFQAFVWDPVQQGYVISTSVERGRGAWIVANSDEGSVALAGNPQRPPDTASGGHLIQLKSGWNLIGNPYQYAIRVGELVGVAASNPEQSYPFAQLVAQGIVSGALAYYDNDAQDYVFTNGMDAPLMPNRGYWIFVGTLQDVTISFPAVFEPFLPGSTRRAESRWVQNDKQWRLKLAARTSKSVDAENYVGIARNTAEANRLRVMEPPMTPIHNVGLSIEEVRNGQASRVSQSLLEGGGRKEWKVTVSTTEAGTVNLTWPNVTTIPKDVKLRLTDTTSGTVRDLRQISAYTFEAPGEATRVLKIEAIPGGQLVNPTIGNVLVTKANGRDPKSPFTINYSLTADATTTIRILSGSGKEVFSVARGRADKAGENSAVWAMKDNANRTVAPGAYRVEIIAETPTGERVRRVVPINVIR